VTSLVPARVGAALLLVTAPRLGAQQVSEAAVLPPPHAVVTSGRVLLWAPVRDTSRGPLLRLQLPGRTVPAATIDSGRFLHQAVVLSPGANRIVLTRGDSVLLTWTLWYGHPGVPGESAPDAATFVLHRDVAPSRCGRCHGGAWQTAPGAAVRLDSVACFGCHAEVTGSRHRHGPAAGWLCLACHRTGPDGKLEAPPRRVGPMCLSCHADVGARVTSAVAAHGPAAGGYCTVCHDPHGAERPALLRTPVSALCANCHEDHADGTHVVGWTGQARPHPVTGVPDPRRSGVELTCASCHEAHGSAGRSLFRGARSKEELCGQCHAGPGGPRP
jgi:predicted CXXCH cytochrome family protein